MRFRRFSREGVVEALPETIDDHATRAAPIPARLFSAHFAFTLGRFCRDVPHDPKVYFFGEEPTIAVRAFTHGYDLFHPHRLILWHHYGRGAMPKHWGDHEQWAFHDARSLQRVRQLLRIDGTPCEIDFGPYGLGHVRSLRDWEVYAGINYGIRGVSDYALRNEPPPDPQTSTDESAWLAGFVREQSVRVRLVEDDMPAAVDDCDFWYVGAHDAQEVELFRHDLAGAALETFMNDPSHERAFTFYSSQFVDSWTVWPHSRSRGWLTKITRKATP
jgi:hypothetical protein